MMCKKASPNWLLLFLTLGTPAAAQQRHEAHRLEVTERDPAGGVLLGHDQSLIGIGITDRHDQPATYRELGDQRRRDRIRSRGHYDGVEGRFRGPAGVPVTVPHHHVGEP